MRRSVRGMMAGHIKAILALTLFAATIPAHAQIAAPTDMVATKKGFSFPETGPIRILLFRPDVSVTQQNTGGVDAPNADWTAQARSNLVDALTKAQVKGENEVSLMPDLTGDDGRVMADYRLLLRAVVRSAFVHRLAAEDRLPTKAKAFDWTLGMGAQRLGQIGGGDYGLFMFSDDSFGTAGRRAVEIVGTLLGAEAAPEKHMGYAGLVDLKTGDIVWLNVDPKMRGDIRTAEGANHRMRELLAQFPKRGGKPLFVIGD